MSDIRILHLADLHLDSPFRGLARRDEELARKVSGASLGSLSRAVGLAIEREVDLVTIGGDAFDGQDRSLHAQWYLRRELRRLGESGIPVLLVAGNHDPITDWSKEIGLPESAFIFPPGEVGRYPLIKDGEVAAEVYGISFGVREVFDNLALKFPADSGAVPRIGLLHANVGANPNHDPYAPAAPAELSSRGMDVWLLGHIHKPEVLQERDPLIIYPGCTQGRDPGEAGPRGCFLVEISGREAGCRFLTTDVIRWEKARVDASEAADIMALADRMIDAGEELLADLEPTEEGLVVRWHLTGRSALQRDLSAPGGPSELEGLLTEAFSSRSPYLLTESISVDLKATIDLENLKGRQDIVGDLIELAAAAETDGEWRQELRRALDPLFEDDSQGRRHIAGVGEDEFRQLLERALSLGLDRLLPEEPQ